MAAEATEQQWLRVPTASSIRSEPELRIASESCKPLSVDNVNWD